MDEDNTISQVVKDNLCTGCGTCIAMCPEEAIRMVINEKKGIYVPELNEDKCNNCGTCYKVCPGHEVDFKQLNLEIFGKEPENILIGNYLNCYVGHATDYHIRYNSSSGGLVTALLIFALEEGIIDGALVTRMKKDNPLEPEPFIARTREEISEASKSKYCPVPANVALREILEVEGKYAVVGLPCHVHGLRKAEQINKKLRERIVLHLGIVCNHTPTFLATEYLLKKMKAKKENITKLDYRGMGWPGRMKVESIGGNTTSPIIHEYWLSGFGTHFYPNRCTLCCDQTCELADCSFADAWLPELENDNIGISIFVNRSEIAGTLFKNMFTRKKIELREIDSDKLIQSQGNVLHSRKKVKTRMIFSKLFRKKLPKYEAKLLEPTYMDYLKTILLYLRMWSSTKQYLWWLISIEGDFKVYMMRYIKNHENVLKLYRRVVRRRN